METQDLPGDMGLTRGHGTYPGTWDLPGDMGLTRGHG